jgi:glycine betaine catabolism B
MNLSFYRNLVTLNGAIPAMVLAWDAWQGQLGANSVNIAIHITGVLSLVFLFMSLLITPLRALTGWNSLIAYRRALGLYGFFYAAVHLVIYVALDRMGSLASTFEEITTRRFLTVGFAAVCLMMPLAVTSTNSMIRRLGATRWKLLHRLAYVATALGVLHYFMLVKSDVRQPLAFAAVLAPMLAFRPIKHYIDLRRTVDSVRRGSKASGLSASKPKSSFWSGTMIVANIHRESHDVKTFRFIPESGAELPFTHQSGQYLNLSLNVDATLVRRSYTIASSPTRRGSIEISVKRNPSGVGSVFLHDQVKVGDRIKIGAPAGKFFLVPSNAKQVVFIAGGIGVTPLMSMLRYVTDAVVPIHVDFIYCVKSRQDFAFYDELRALVTRFPNIKLRVFLTREEKTDSFKTELDDRWIESCQQPTADHIRAMAAGWQRASIYLCGPDPMMEAFRKHLVEAGIANENIATEAFVSPATQSSGTSKESGDASAIDSTAVNSAAIESATIAFNQSHREVTIDGSQTILEAAESGGVPLPWECRSGICGQCKVKCIEGRVHMDSTDALSLSERQSGLILACQSHPLDDRVVIQA